MFLFLQMCDCIHSHTWLQFFFNQFLQFIKNGFLTLPFILIFEYIFCFYISFAHTHLLIKGMFFHQKIKLNLPDGYSVKLIAPREFHPFSVKLLPLRAAQCLAFLCLHTGCGWAGVSLYPASVLAESGTARFYSSIVSLFCLLSKNKNLGASAEALLMSGMYPANRYSVIKVHQKNARIFFLTMSME